jgi:hypothetical protein
VSWLWLCAISDLQDSNRWSQNAEDERDNESSKGRKDEACDCHVFDAEIAG